MGICIVDLLVFFHFVLTVFDLVSLVTILTNSQIDRSSFAGRSGGREGESGWLLQNDQTDQSVISLLKEQCQEALISGY